MGTGWEYFNNVCQALRVAIGVVASIVGVVAAFLIYGAVAAHLQSAPSDTAPASIYQQGDAPISPDPKSANTTMARGSATGTGTSAAPASANASRTPVPSAPGVSAAPRSSSYHPNTQPNPQFGGGGGSQVNPQFGGGR